MTQTIDKPQPGFSSDTIANAAKKSCSSLEKCVGDFPASAMLISSIVGVGVGIAIGMMLGRAREPEPIGWFDSRTAEKIGRQVLTNVYHWVPESVSNRFHS